MIINVPIFITLVLIGMALIAIVNVLLFPRLGTGPRSAGQPLVSILIPARDEAAVIGHTVRSLLTQSYQNFELIVLDDHSADGTVDEVRRAAQNSPRLRIVTGKPLPSGWLGKNWACHQLAQEARGDWLIFTDADVRWAPHALSALVAEMTQTTADLLTVWPTQHSQTWAERLTVPLMALVVLGYLPLPFVHHTPWPVFAAANGQCLAFRRRAYRAIGGHTAVQNEVLEDVILARRVKGHGLRLRMADGAGLVTCRMYQDWPAVRAGFAKNILAGYGGRVTFLLLATLFHWLIFLLPWLWLVAGWLTPGLPGWPLWPLLLIGLSVGLRALTAAATRQRLADAFLMPLSVLLMTRIAAQAVWWQWRYGGPLWKGRIVRKVSHAQAGGLDG
jgi:chlorobactene glucosyltransferase